MTVTATSQKQIQYPWNPVNAVALKAWVDAVTAIVNGTLPASMLSADTEGRAAMQTGYFNEATATDKFAAAAIVGTLLKAGALAATPQGRALMATGLFDEATATDKFAAGAIVGSLLKDATVAAAKLDATMAPVRRVRAVTTTNVGSFTGVSTSLDGLTLVAGDRILVSAESTGANEGIYVVGTVDGGIADWTRAADWAASAVIPNGTIVVVDAGTAGANTVYKLTNTGIITVGSTDLTFERLYTSTELASTAASKGASLLGVQDADALISATNTETALKEIASGGLATTSPIHIVAGMTTGDVTLATFAVSNDGLTLTEGERVLVRAQTAPEENGVYVVGAVDTGNAPLTRAKDWDANAEIKPNTLVAVTGGTAGANTLWQLTGDFPTNLGTSHAHFTQVYNATQVTAAGLTIAKRTVDITDDILTGAGPQVVPIGEILPANAVVLGHELNVTEAFVGLDDVTITVGGTDADAIVGSTDLDALSTGKTCGTMGVLPTGTFGGQQLAATVDSAAGNMDDLSAGSVTITVWYSVLA